MHSLIRNGVFTGLSLLASTLAAAPFEILHTEDFETGQATERLVPNKDTSAPALTMLDYASSSDTPGIVAPPWTASVLGLRGARFQPDQLHRHLSLQFSEGYARTSPDQPGIIIQADFHLPPPDRPCPTIAIMAAPAGKAPGFAMYRFGILEDAAKVFFSFSDGVTPGPRVYHAVPSDGLPISRPGWNRLQMRLKAGGGFEFRLNGHDPSIPSVTDSTLPEIVPGVFVSESGNADAVIVDNLIVYTARPDGTWPELPPGAGAPPSQAAAPPTPRPATPGPSPAYQPATSASAPKGISWFTDPAAAEEESRRSGRTVLLVFTNPGFDSHKAMMRLLEAACAEDSEAAKLIFQSVLVDTDSGNQAATKHRIFQVPALVLVDSNGKEVRRLAASHKVSDPGQVRAFLHGSTP